MKKIAFITDGIRHPSKDSTFKVLQKYYPEHTIEVINILDIIKKKKILQLVNIYFIIKEYFFHYFFGEKTFLFYFMRTTYIFKQIKKIIAGYISKDTFEFSFQAPSFIDVSTPGLPHFTYSDIVHLTYFDMPSHNKWHQNSNAWLKLEKSIYHSADLNFVFSTNIRRDMIEKYSIPPDKVVCVYAGANVQPPVDQQLDPERYNNKNILFVGRDWERKGGPELVQAFKLVLKKHPDAKLTIIGCAPHIELTNCRILGKLSLEDLGKEYKKATVFCMPTKREPFGLVFVEALAYKLPVVATNLCAVPDFVIDGENGYKVKPGDVQELAYRLNELISDPLKCKSFGENGYRLFQERYNWDQVGLRIKENIESVLGRKPAKSYTMDLRSA